MSILLVEDNENRIRWFQDKLPKFDLAKTAAEGIKMVQEKVYNQIFLDHDLGNRIFVDSSDENTGYQVALAIAETTNKNANITIHSMNPGGARMIKNILPNAVCIPFCFLNIKEKK